MKLFNSEDGDYIREYNLLPELFLDIELVDHMDKYSQVSIIYIIID